MRKTKNKLKKMCLLLTTFLCSGVFAITSVHAQQTVTGVMTDQTGETIIGANVIEAGTTNGTISDLNGEFSLSVSSLNATLNVSYIGYQSIVFPLNGQSKVAITLKEDLQNLEEVVVVGYGVVKKRDLTGSVASVKGDKIQEVAAANPLDALQGRAAGVSVMQTSATPGGATSIRIRGNRSLKADNSPLYVIDGIPIVGGLGEINTSDIESMEILKDASATAIYGSRGANGVVLITTKKGKAGKAEINYNGYYGVQEATRKIDVFNGAEWIEMVRESNRATSKTTPYPLTPSLDADRRIGYFTAAPDVWSKIENSYDADGNWHPDWVKDNDWMGEALQTAPIHNHEVSVRGGTEQLRVAASATYFSQDGIVKGQDYQRYSVRFNFDWQLTERVKIGGNTQFSHSDRTPGNNLYQDTRLIYPLCDIFDENGNYTTSRPGNDPQLWNQFLNLEHKKREQKRDRFTGSYYLEARLPLDVIFRTNVGIEISPYTNNEFFGMWGSDRAGASQARAINRAENRRTYTWENMLMYNKQINKDHNIGVTLMQSIQQDTEEKNSIEVRDLPYENQLWYNVGTAQTIDKVGSDYVRWRLASFMGRVNYSFKDKYLLTVSARYDGSSRLATDHKWVLFPSAALAWRIKEESFLKDIDILSNLKIRAGYGITGNTAIDPYKTQGSLAYGRYTYGSNGVLSFYQNEMPNPYLTWEKTAQWNAGIDFGFFNGRLGGVIDIYQQETEDLLMERQLPVVSGFPNVMSNIGKIRNRGLEITINTVNIDTKGFKWNTDLMFATNKEEITELYNGKEDDPGNSWFIGKPVNVFYDYKAGGIWQLEDAEELGKWGGIFKPGDIKIVDKNGDYKITSDDRFILGQVEPKLTLSMSNYFYYKNFDLNFFVNGAFGQMRKFNSGLRLSGRYNGAKVNYWRIIGEDANGNPVSNQSNEAPRPNIDFENPSYIDALYYHKASFVRLKSVTLGYNLPASATKALGISKLRIYGSIDNVFLITDYKGVDPELGNKSDNLEFNEPMPRTYRVGVNLTF
jgi:TonB-linked SusC/RagA family outer membrane protein